MLQRVWGQLAHIGIISDVHIVASASHIEIIKQQLGSDISVIIEPERRDTFPAISLSCLYLKDVLKIPEDEIICVLPVDPYVESEYFQNILEMERVLEASSAELVLMGAQPTYPSGKYGYIIPGVSDRDKRYFNVQSFFEKPSEQQAEKLIEERALWNCGVFAFKLSYVLDIMREKKQPLSFSKLQQTYDQLEKISFDFAVVEEAQKVVAISYNGYWKDLGTWNTITEEIQENIIGRGTLSEDSRNTHIVNELNIPVFVLNISNAVIAVSHEGILVTDKPTSPRLKELMKDFKQITMYEERHWGTYRVLDHLLKDGKHTITKRVKVYANSTWCGKTSEKEIHIITVVSGVGILSQSKILNEYGLGEVINIHPNQGYNFHSRTQDLEFILVQIFEIS